MNEIVYAQLHAHSRYSINNLSGEGVIHKYVWPIERQIIKNIMLKAEKIEKIAKSLGLSYVALTEHNTVPDYESDVIIKSEEWGQKKGHSSFINIKETINPECEYFKNFVPNPKLNFTEAAKKAKENGAFIIINHPFKKDLWKWGEESYEFVDAIEIWNGPWNNENEKAYHFWKKLIENKKRILPVAGNDFHIPYINKLNENLIVSPRTNSKEEFIKILKKGAYSITKNTFTPAVFINEDLEFEIINCKGEFIIKMVSNVIEKKISKNICKGNVDIEIKDFVYIELWKDNMPLSFSSPIFL
ncbi:MAG: hypothetical protein QW037_01365, partial [Thermoplasmata archaeon]